jgi:hypothetical protein
MDRVRASRLLPAVFLAGSLMPLFAGPDCAAAQAADKAFEQAWSEADALRKQAAAAGFEWLKTGELLEDARDAFAAGQPEMARERLRLAREQAGRALEQAKRESEAWKRRVVR